jgi:hypoxanthine phosphoribosyltransferase
VKFYKGIGSRGTKPIITQPIMADMAGKKVLIVDDVVESGRTLEVVTELCSIRGASAVRTAALYLKPWAMMNPDYFAAKVEEWVVFPWEVGETLRELREEGESLHQAMKRLGAPYGREVAEAFEAIEKASANPGGGEGG